MDASYRLFTILVISFDLHTREIIMSTSVTCSLLEFALITTMVSTATSGTRCRCHNCTGASVRAYAQSQLLLSFISLVADSIPRAVSRADSRVWINSLVITHTPAYHAMPQTKMYQIYNGHAASCLRLAKNTDILTHQSLVYAQDQNVKPVPRMSE